MSSRVHERQANSISFQWGQQEEKRTGHQCKCDPPINQVMRPNSTQQPPEEDTMTSATTRNLPSTCSSRQQKQPPHEKSNPITSPPELTTNSTTTTTTTTTATTTPTATTTNSTTTTTTAAIATSGTSCRQVTHCKMAKQLLVISLVVSLFCCLPGAKSNIFKSPSLALAAELSVQNDLQRGGSSAPATTSSSKSNGDHSSSSLVFDNQVSHLEDSERPPAAASNNNEQQQLSSSSDNNRSRQLLTDDSQSETRRSRQVAAGGGSTSTTGTTGTTGSSSSCGNGGRKRGKRHLAAAGANSNADDCNKLSTFWLFLRANYPSLARHLFEWAVSSGGQQSDEQFLWARSSQVGRTVGRLLDEADRLIGRPGDLAASSNNNAGWLSRVNSNPAYVKLIHQIQKSKQQQQQQQHSIRPNYLATAKEGEQRPPGGGGEQSGQQQQQQQQHFGKVVNYPHEIAATDNSYGMTRTYNKLRILDQHNKQLNEQLTNENNNNNNNNNEDNEQLISNKIPTINYQDIEANVDLRKSLELADNARNKFVYGNVLLRPKQQTNGDEQLKPKKPIDSLRDYVSQEHKQQQQQRQQQQQLHHQNPNHNHNHNHRHHINDDQLALQLSGAGGGRRVDDELLSQQRAQQVASEEEAEGEAQDSLDEPFPGVVLSSPIKHAEVRQLRSSDLGPSSTAPDLNGIKPLD